MQSRTPLRPRRLTAILFLLAAACSPRGETIRKPPYVHELYISERTDAQVVDAATGEPIANAAIVVVWRKISIYVERWEGIQFFSDISTGPDGRFTIERWGPRPGSAEAFLDRRDPEIWVLKAGYMAAYFDNEGASEPYDALPGDPPLTHYVKLPPHAMPGWTRGAYARAATASSIWNGKTLPLKRGRDDRERGATLAAANPLDPYLPMTLTPIPNYWAEWHRCRDALSPPVRALVTFPPKSVVDRVTPVQLPSR
ncbi:MAG TPA: hypothetical protein VEU30_04010 [Thermoanaerobaculia bacterium]|nr:hypothetical protein [Thermoanaerobaculia bacterium]